MSQQIINVGSAPNDGTGDLLRNSQIKANANFTELYNSVVTNTSDLINDGEDGVNPFISLLDLPSNLILYPTTATSDVSGYVKLVTDIHDVDYNTTAVDVITGSITGTNQLIASLITTAGLIVGNAGVFNTTTIGNIRKTAGSGNAEFYYLIYKRTSLGVETLVGTSNPTIPVSSAVYTQFNTVALWDDGIFDVTDRIVLKFYASKVGGGSSPTYDFQFGGSAPVRTLVPVSLSVIPTDALSNQITDYTNATLPLTGTENLILNDGTGWKKLSSGDLVVSGGGSNKRTVNYTYEFNGVLSTATNNWCGATANGVPSMLISSATLTPSNNFSAAPVQSPAWVVPFNCRLKSIIIKGFSNTGSGIVDLAFSSGTYLGSGSTLVNNTILSNQPFTLHNYLGVNNFAETLQVTDTGFTNYVIPKGYEIRMFMNNRNVAKNLLSTTILIEFEEEI